LSAVRDLILIAFVLGGLLGASQIPKFIQEYEQRLGGARDETTRLLSGFKAIARRSGQTLSTYAARLAEDRDTSVGGTGKEIQGLVRRNKTLSNHSESLTASHRLLKPFFVAQDGDREIVAATWGAFHYTLTLDHEFGLVGLVIGWLIHATISALIGLLAPRERYRMPRPRR